MPITSFQRSGLRRYFEETGEAWLFARHFFREAVRRPFEWRELLNQCFIVGNQSLFLVGMTGLIMGLVLTLQTRPTLALSWWKT